MKLEVPITVWKMSKYGPVKAPYLDTLYVVNKLIDNLALLILEATTKGLL